MTNREILLADGWTPLTQKGFGDHAEIDSRLEKGVSWDDAGQNVGKLDQEMEPAFYVWTNLNWQFPDDVGFSGWKVIDKHLSWANEISWWHSTQLQAPYTHCGGPFRAACADYAMGGCALFQQQKFCPTTKLEITYEGAIKVGEVLETLQTSVKVIDEGRTLVQEGIQRIYGTDTIIGHFTSTPYIPKPKS